MITPIHGTVMSSPSATAVESRPSHVKQDAPRTTFVTKQVLKERTYILLQTWQYPSSVIRFYLSTS
jgi:hypothetical protein